MPSRTHLGLVVVTIVSCAAMWPPVPLFGQSKESEAERLQRSCGPPDVKHGIRVNRLGRVEQATPDNAVVHVVRPSAAMGGAIQTKLAVDGKWVGVNVGGTYFTVSLAPGTHALCSQAGNRVLIDLTVEAGRTYYVEQRPVSNLVGKLKNALRLLDDKQGLRALASCRQSEMFEKIE
jgi:hypothetical protein